MSIKGYTLVASGLLECLFLNLADWKSDKVKILKDNSNFYLWVPNEYIDWVEYRSNNFFQFVGEISYNFDSLELRTFGEFYLIVDSSCPEIVEIVESGKSIKFITENDFIDVNPPWIYSFSKISSDDAWSKLS